MQKNVLFHKPVLVHVFVVAPYLIGVSNLKIIILNMLV